jgi:hypothetical protein
MEVVWPSSQSMVRPFQAVPTTVRRSVVVGSAANAFDNSEGPRLVAGHCCASLTSAIIIWVIVIRQLSRRSDIQFAWVEGYDRSTLTGNLDKRSVIVHTTPPLGWVNGGGTSRHLKEQQCCSDHKCKGDFHQKSFRLRTL